jgi:enoyl-CoA hydratase
VSTPCHDNRTAPLLVDADGPVRILTLNRPDLRNAVAPDLRSRLHRIWVELEEDEDARAVVLTGAGSFFCAGGDIKSFPKNQASLHVRRKSLREAARLMESMLAFPLPLVAAVNGPAIGLGCSLAVSSDLVVMSEEAYFADTHVSIGLVAGDGGAVAWPMMTSILLAKQYLLTGDRIPAAEAVRIGLANEVVPRDQVVARALELAHRLAAQPPQAVQETKRAINLHLQHAARLVLPFALAAESESFTTTEVAETIRRFA